MKTTIKKVLIASFILTGVLIYTPTFADPPGMPGGHGDSGDQPPGGGAPIGGGALILSGLAVAYAFSRKRVDYTIVEEEKES
jgi:hypothetical protein